MCDCVCVCMRTWEQIYTYIPIWRWAIAKVLLANRTSWGLHRQRCRSSLTPWTVKMRRTNFCSTSRLELMKRKTTHPENGRSNSHGESPKIHLIMAAWIEIYLFSQWIMDMGRTPPKRSASMRGDGKIAVWLTSGSWGTYCGPHWIGLLSESEGGREGRREGGREGSRETGDQRPETGDRRPEARYRHTKKYSHLVTSFYNQVSPSPFIHLRDLLQRLVLLVSTRVGCRYVAQCRIWWWARK